jgi:CheY-like chemotaxis protein
MGGDIWFESTHEKETTFYLKLPYENAIVRVEKPRVFKENIPDLSDKTIFIVEDILFNTTLLISYLEPTRANIITADNGNDALIKFNDNKDNIDLILMDIQLPEMSGIEITSIIRMIDKEIPIIAQTAYAMKDEIEKIMQSGFNDVIKKPIKREELFSVINKCLI